MALAGAAWYLWPELGGWPVALAAIPGLVQLALGRRWPRLGLFDLAMALFVLTAALGVWAAYDRDGSRVAFATPIGWRKLWGLLLATLLFYALRPFQTEAQRRWLVALLAGFGAAVGMWFAMTNDWQANPAKWDFITRLGQSLQASLPALPGHRLNPNIAGGLTALLLPMALEVSAGWGKSRGRWLQLLWGLTTGAAMLLGLLLSSSRGAWLGLAASLALGGLWLLAGRVGGRRQGWVFVALLAAAAALGGLGLALLPPLRTALTSFALTNRVGIFSQGLLLLRDYPFTGLGLGNFALLHSTYALLIHVPIIVHAHMLFLNVALEQGVGGALALIVILGAAAWRGLRALVSADAPPAGLRAALLSLAVLAAHGLFDDALYGSRGLLLLWLPAGLILAATQGLGIRPLLPWRWRLSVTAGALALALLLLLVFARPLLAAWYANRGALAQSLVELSLYDYNHFDNPTLDQVRREADLTAAEAFFWRALALEPGQATARTRLAQIALARGEYERALAHMQAAWAAGHRDRVTRLVLGDALVAQGYVEQAAEVVRGVSWAQDRLRGQSWYIYGRTGDWQRMAYVCQTLLLLDPEDEYARRGLRQAEERLGE